MNNSFSCIIPFYNEGLRVLKVVRVISNMNSVSQIICVDDGSTDDTGQLLVKEFPKVILVRLDSNKGKARAIFKGLELAKNKNLLLIDADLGNLKSEELDGACNKFVEDQSVDLIIFKIKGNNKFVDELLRKYIFLGGNRILRKTDLEAVEKSNPYGYQLEVAINKHMVENHRKVFWTKCSAFNPHKAKKFSFIEGMKKDLKMELSIISFLGYLGYLKQMILFCRKELE